MQKQIERLRDIGNTLATTGHQGLAIAIKHVADDIAEHVEKIELTGEVGPAKGSATVTMRAPPAAITSAPKTAP